MQQQLQQAQHTAVQLVLEQKHEEAITFTIKEFRPRSLALIEKAKRFYERQSKLLEALGFFNERKATRTKFLDRESYCLLMFRSRHELDGGCAEPVGFAAARFPDRTYQIDSFPSAHQITPFFQRSA